MAYDVASSINELLFQHNSVIVPQFGGFELSKNSASIDHIKSVISPPSKVAKFNKNLIINDGVLVDYIRKQNRCTLEQAKQIVKDFVKEAESKLAEKEIIEIPKVGRIYKDYNQSLKFLPYDTNFDTDAFGLPEVKIHPFSRSQSVKKEAVLGSATSTVSNAIPPVGKTERTTAKAKTEISASPLQEEEKIATIPLGEQTKSTFRWAKMAIPFLVIASIAMIAVSFFFLKKGNDKVAYNKNDSAKKVAVKERTNVSPSIEEAEITTLPSHSESGINYDKSDEEKDLIDEVNASFERDENASYSSGEDEIMGDGKECIIIVGQFAVKKNARNLSQKIETDGYESYMGWNDKKQWNTVGVKFSYQNENEKEDMLNRLKQEYDVTAWVLRG